jgi:hypothetical protein
VYKVFKRKDLSPYFGSGLLALAVKCESPAGEPDFAFYLYFYCSELRETKMPVMADLFLGGRFFILSCL